MREGGERQGVEDIHMNLEGEKLRTKEGESEEGQGGVNLDSGSRERGGSGLPALRPTT